MSMPGWCYLITCIVSGRCLKGIQIMPSVGVRLKAGFHEASLLDIVGPAIKPVVKKVSGNAGIGNTTSGTVPTLTCT